MKAKTLCALLFTLYFLPFTLYAAGTNSAEFLTLGHGAAAEGLSGAFTALAGDANSIYWNSAGLSGLKNTEVSFTYNSWISDISRQYVAAGVPLNNGGGFGVGVEYINLGEFTGRRSQTSASYGFGAGDVIIALGVAGKLSRNTSAGITVKYLRETIEDVNAQSIALDFGLKKKIGTRTTLGVVLQNAGAGIKYVQRIESLPTALNAGVAYTVGGLQFGFDVKRRLNSNSTEISFGMEFTPLGPLALRSGLLNSIVPQSGTAYKFSGGFGLKLGRNTFDYSFSPMAGFGFTHNASFSVKF